MALSWGSVGKPLKYHKCLCEAYLEQVLSSWKTLLVVSSGAAQDKQVLGPLRLVVSINQSKGPWENDLGGATSFPVCPSSLWGAASYFVADKMLSKHYLTPREPQTSLHTHIHRL